MNRITLTNIALISCFVFILSCKKDTTLSGTDAELYEKSKSTAGFTYFKNSDELLDKSSGTGHSHPFLRTRYNATAATKLDSNGKIIEGAVFPEGSLIVKELFENATTLDRYAILYKNSTSPDADAKGWVWGYIEADGKVAEPASNKGASCINCHTQSGSIDYMLMNKYFP
ncbi:MAG: cytochrome P460 family protein [Flavobacteriia bacterium]